MCTERFDDDKTCWEGLARNNGIFWCFVGGVGGFLTAHVDGSGLINQIPVELTRTTVLSLLVPVCQASIQVIFISLDIVYFILVLTTTGSYAVRE